MGVVGHHVQLSTVQVQRQLPVGIDSGKEIVPATVAGNGTGLGLFHAQLVEGQGAELLPTTGS
eukprot:scaffold264256_cov38-Prasinocladus_malaysianus.AAC.1